MSEKLDNGLTNKQRMVFRQWIFCRRQRTLLPVGGGSSRLNVMLTIAESGQRDEGRNLIPTVQDDQNMPSDPSPNMRTEQLHGFETG